MNKYNKKQINFSFYRKFKNKILLFSILLICLLAFASCNNANTDVSKDRTQGDFRYPTKPVTELKNFLESDIKKRGLPLTVSDIESVKWDETERLEFFIRHLDNSENACVVSFTISSPNYDCSLDGNDNPSFTIAFKDPEKSQDMVTVLISVIRYLSPDMDLEEAKRLVIKQDDTISIDGYSTPQELGGYQIQAHYTNPHIYFTTKDFEAKLGVTVTALKQIWGNEIDFSLCQKLSDSNEFSVLSHNATLEDDYSDKAVYADFIVKDWWVHEDYLHGDIETRVTVEAMNGETYSLRLNYLRTPYELGIGEKYTLYISPNPYGAIIFYAKQLNK